jgi:hypothetical protein
MHPFPTLAASALLLLAAEVDAVANSSRIAETGAVLLGNAYRCGVANERVVRAGRVIRELIVAASDDANERAAAKLRFAEIFRASAQPEGEGRGPTPPCKSVLIQFERLEQFRDRVTTK